MTQTAPEKTGIHELLDRLDAVKSNGNGYTARCPAHEDQSPSLSVFWGKDKRWHVHCFAGCNLNDIKAAIGLDNLKIMDGGGMPEQKQEATISTAEMKEYAKQCYDHVFRDRLSEVLGVSEWSLECLRVGWDGGLNAWTLPMWNMAGEICGIEYRPADEQKKRWCVRGSRRGMFIPRVCNEETHALEWPIASRSVLCICEGLSDTAAALNLGFNAIGRPGKDACSDHCVHWATDSVFSAVLIIRDRDEGDPKTMQRTRYSADAVAAEIALSRKVRRVKVVRPPKPGIKDLRDWIGDGATKDALMEEAKIEEDFCPRDKSE